jgi:hypothetical protein
MYSFVEFANLIVLICLRQKMHFWEYYWMPGFYGKHFLCFILLAYLAIVAMICFLIAMITVFVVLAYIVAARLVCCLRYCFFGLLLGLGLVFGLRLGDLLLNFNIPFS